ncbi:Brp/Blh family beta-carotene 15,15'-dioxygenase [uncultured Polaribacter sp.]|uniref:Brp/Blh family beta-carotene 15,15'-dioxygenase n=1 Tax=uncultured Polaribacter sp. TaxID=174711 RepID=UPI00260DF285|nr:Brp/Blh family beta-carotene 15,15'-dioxygenase [uncultured Polaribacter sp.]
MLNYQNFKIFFTFFLFWLGLQFGQLIEDTIAYFLVLSVGIIHGSNDLLILKRKAIKQKVYVLSILYYTLLIILCVVFFVLTPFVSLILFIVLSAYHFGEQHLEAKIKGPYFLALLLYIAYGTIIFSLIFLENLAGVDKIVNDLTGNFFTENVITVTLISSSTLTVLIMLYLYVNKCTKNINFVKELFYIVLLYLIFKSGSLMYGFAIYFVLWHSIPSIIDQTKYLSGEANKLNILKYLKSAGLIWLFSILGLVLTYILVDKSYFISVIFLVLFAVTLPHVWVMYKMKN